jgi:hypothetical protein
MEAKISLVCGTNRWEIPAPSNLKALHSAITETLSIEENEYTLTSSLRPIEYESEYKTELSRNLDTDL